jgi:hypothetical protein
MGGDERPSGAAVSAAEARIPRTENHLSAERHVWALLEVEEDAIYEALVRQWEAWEPEPDAHSPDEWDRLAGLLRRLDAARGC